MDGQEDRDWWKAARPIYLKKIFDGKGFKIDLPEGSITFYFENVEKWNRGEYHECKGLYRPNSKEWIERKGGSR